MKSVRSLAASVAFGIGLFAFAPDADACSGPLFYLCRGTTVVAVPSDPPTLELRMAPSNADGFSLTHSTTAPTVTVTDKDGAPIDVTVTAHASGNGRWILTPATPLIAKATYKVKWEAQCESSSATSPETKLEADVEAVAPAPPPTALGTLKVQGPTKRTFALNSCDRVQYSGDEVIAKIDLDADPSFAPWRSVIGVTMTMDGKALPPNPPWEQTWSDGFGFMRASCESPDATGITPTVHTFTFSATPPGGGTPLTAETTVDFTCATAPASSSGIVGGGEGSTSGGGGGPVPESSDSGCTTASAPAGASWLPVLLLAMLGLASARKRDRS